MLRRSTLVIALFVFAGSAFGQINLGKLKEKAEEVIPGGSSTGLSNEEVVEGLKEALSVGTDKGTALASKEDGFFKNPKIFIPFPPDAQKVKDKVEKLGMQKQVDEFVMTMNRAAEEASKEAGPIFLDAVKGMSVGDGFAILKGEDDAATTYLDSKTRIQLKDKFTPIVKSAIEKVQVTKYWNPLITKYNTVTAFSGGEKVDPDLESYITDRALQGLFVLLAEEELKIRKDPIARVNDILKKVFGSLDD